MKCEKVQCKYCFNLRYHSYLGLKWKECDVTGKIIFDREKERKCKFVESNILYLK